jgi:hypothetical protein
MSFRSLTAESGEMLKRFDACKDEEAPPFAVVKAGRPFIFLRIGRVRIVKSNDTVLRTNHVRKNRRLSAGRLANFDLSQSVVFNLQVNSVYDRRPAFPTMQGQRAQVLPAVTDRD